MLQQGYDPEHYYKDTVLHSKIQEIYTATIGYNTGTVFPIQINGCIICALLDIGAERSCMNLETFKTLRINNLNTSFIPTVKGATGHDLFVQGITTCDFRINDYMFTNSFIVSNRQSRSIILGREFTIPNAITVGWTRIGTKNLCTDDELVMECQENSTGKALAYPLAV